MSFIEFLKYFLYSELLISILELIILFVFFLCFRGRLRAFINRYIRVTRVHKNQGTPYPEDDFDDYCPGCGYHLDYCGCQLDDYEDCDCKACDCENYEDCNHEDDSENSSKQTTTTTTPKE